MTSLAWDDKYNMGIDVLDVQHHKIFDCMTTIYVDLVDLKQNGEYIYGMLEQLEMLCQMHFADEQIFMDKNNYSLATEHKPLHELLLANIFLIKSNFKQYHATKILKEFIHIREDYITHLINETMLLGEFIKNSSSIEVA